MWIEYERDRLERVEFNQRMRDEIRSRLLRKHENQLKEQLLLRAEEDREARKRLREEEKQRQQEENKKLEEQENERREEESRIEEEVKRLEEEGQILVEQGVVGEKKASNEHNDHHLSETEEFSNPEEGCTALEEHGEEDIELEERSSLNNDRDPDPYLQMEQEDENSIAVIPTDESDSRTDDDHIDISALMPPPLRPINVTLTSSRVECLSDLPRKLIGQLAATVLHQGVESLEVGSWCVKAIESAGDVVDIYTRAYSSFQRPLTTITSQVFAGCDLAFVDLSAVHKDRTEAVLPSVITIP